VHSLEFAVRCVLGWLMVLAVIWVWSSRSCMHLSLCSSAVCARLVDGTRCYLSVVQS